MLKSCIKKNKSLNIRGTDENTEGEVGRRGKLQYLIKPALFLELFTGW